MIPKEMIFDENAMIKKKEKKRALLSKNSQQC
jgi:hypothetical protein